MALLRRLLVSVLVISIGLPLPAQAGMLPTQTALSGASTARERLVSLLERHGVNPAEVKARVAALSDDEAAQLASRIDQLPAGGDGVEALVGALLLVFIILLITDILGFTKVFPFTKPIQR